MKLVNLIKREYEAVRNKKNAQISSKPIIKKTIKKQVKKKVTINRIKVKNKKDIPEKIEHNINLVLGSGIARGYAHIPIIQRLQKDNIKFKEIAGTSAGAIIGAYLALYGEVDSLEIFIKTLKKKDFLRLIHLNNPKRSIVKLDKVKALFSKLFKDKTFKDTKIPLVICATKINTNEAVYIRKGKILDAVMASISIPGLFPSYVFNKGHYVDGGITDPLPITCVRNKELKTVAVDLYKINKGHIKEYSALNVALLSYYIMEERITEGNRPHSKSVFILRPNFGSGKLDALDFSAYNKFHAPGANIIRANIGKISKWLNE